MPCSFPFCGPKQKLIKGDGFLTKMEHQGKQTCLQWLFEKYGMRAGFKNGLSRMTPENANEVRKGTDFPDPGSKYHALSDMEEI
jgi:hypothetical protein